MNLLNNNGGSADALPPYFYACSRIICVLCKTSDRGRILLLPDSVTNGKARVGRHLLFVTDHRTRPLKTPT